MNDNKTAWIIGIIVALVVLFVIPWGGMMGYGGYGNMMSMMYNYYGSSYGYGMMGGFGFGWIFMIAILILVVLAIVWLAQQIQNQGRRRR